MGGPGQAALRKARVLVIGAGGLGAPVLFYLAAAGVGTLGIVDDDLVSLSNLQRQVVHTTHDIGDAKVDSAAAAIARLWSDGELTEQLVARGRKRLERLTWPSTARRLRALYRLALGAGLTADDRRILQDEPPV